MFSQDPPDDFEFNQSTQQGFYFFLNIDILGEELNENDWIGVFNSYDETLGGECTQEEMNTDETLGGMCMTLAESDFQCTPGFPDYDSCVANNLCNSSLDIDGDNLLTECACADINDDGLIFSQNLEIIKNRKLVLTDERDHAGTCFRILLHSRINFTQI